MAKKKNKLPEKRTMNLYKNGEKNRISGRKKVLIIALIAVFVLVGVIGRYGLLIYKASKLKSAEAQLATYESQLTNYKEIKTEYDRYAKSYLTAQEKALEDRTTIILAANRCVGSFGDIYDVSISSNSATISVELKNMHDLPTIVSNFEHFNNIAFVNVDNIIRTTGQDEEGNAAGHKITANISYGIGEQVSESQEVQ